MARIEPLGIHEVDDEIRHACEEAERQTGTSASSRSTGSIVPSRARAARNAPSALNTAGFFA